MFRRLFDIEGNDVAILALKRTNEGIPGTIADRLVQTSRPGGQESLQALVSVRIEVRATRRGGASFSRVKPRG